MMADEPSIDEINRNLKQLNEEREMLLKKISQRDCVNERIVWQQINKLEQHIADLTQVRSKMLRKKYTRPVIDPGTNPEILQGSRLGAIRRPKVTQVKIEDHKTTLKMVPGWFSPQESEKALDDIVYPTDVEEHRPFDTVARYRAHTGLSNNFRRHKLDLDENSTETLILMLDAFAQQFGGELSFTDETLSFDDSAYRTACGVTNLGGSHLLAANFVPTAGFDIRLNLNYDKDLTGSESTVEDFVLNISRDIAQALGCSEDFVRVISVEKSNDESGVTLLHLGLTNPNQKETKDLADRLRALLNNGTLVKDSLKYVKRDSYSYRWMPTLSYLQLRPIDFAPEHNMDYRVKGLSRSTMRGGYPYYLPIGWYRHALKVEGKYPDGDEWLGSENSPGEWPVVFHGTHTNAATSFTQNGLFVSADETDVARKEAIQQMGSAVDRPGIYLTTHCDGGAHPMYTQSYHLPLIDGKRRQFLLVFMCRVAPGQFTTHESVVPIGSVRRVVDANAVRPYGILVKSDD